jgi:hypothetical protein
LEAVIVTRGGNTVRGRDALLLSTESVLKSIRSESVNSIPHEIQGRYQSDNMTDEDRETLDYMFYQNCIAVIRQEFDRSSNGLQFAWAAARTAAGHLLPFVEALARLSGATLVDPIHGQPRASSTRQQG